MFGTGEIVATVIIVLIVVAGISALLIQASEQRPKILEQKRLARQAQIDGRVALAKARRQCLTCGAAYDPELP